MKFLLLCLLFPVCCMSQKAGYGNVAFSFFGSKSFQNSAGLNLSAGAALGKIVTTGITFDLYPFSGDKKIKYSVVAADFRVFLEGNHKPVSPFIAVQPGYTLYKEKILNVTVRGDFAFGALAGMHVRSTKKMPGFIFAAGYQHISFTANKETSGSNGLKLNIGLSF